MNVKETVAHIATLNTTDEVESFIKGESRIGVINAAMERIKAINAGAVAPAAVPVEEANATPADVAPTTDAAAAEPTAQLSPAPVAHVKKGKGELNTPATSRTVFLLAHPEGAGNISFAGRIYNRQQLAKDQHLLKQLHAKGCRQVKKLA